MSASYSALLAVAFAFMVVGAYILGRIDCRRDGETIIATVERGTEWAWIDFDTLTGAPLDQLFNALELVAQDTAAHLGLEASPRTGLHGPDVQHASLDILDIDHTHVATVAITVERATAIAPPTEGTAP